MTEYGGLYDNGVLFEYNISSNAFTKKVDFNDVNGRSPTGDLTKGTNGRLYGLSRYGGKNGTGVLFEYDPSTNVFIKKFDFDDSIHGGQPYGTLLSAANGKMYGLTYQGGISNAGIIFEYDFSTNELIKKHDFNGFTGNHPYYTALIEESYINGMSLLDQNEDFQIFPNPTINHLKVQSKIFPIINLDVFGMYGDKIISNSNLFSNEISIDFTSFTSGIYFIKIQTSNYLVIKKILKE